jgi:muramoyltetrapeptide carboxypeptidase LdcA involved in peptidoglycan recycling
MSNMGKTILKKGSIIGVVTPSWAGPHIFPKVFELGLKRLTQSFDLKIKEYPNTKISKEESFFEPKRRAEDIMLAYEDPETDLIIASIGGSDSIRILPHLDIDRIKKNPKIFMGFSDSTTLLTYLNQNGLITLHGPSIMAGFAEPEGLQNEFIEHFTDFFFKPWDLFEYKKYSTWTETELPWSDPDFINLKKQYHNNDGWKVIQGTGQVSGKLYGGNLEIFEMMKGTPFMEKLEQLNEVLLFLETSEEAPSISYIQYALRSMGMRGVFNKISALMLGRPVKYSDQDKNNLYETIKKVIYHEFGKKDLPIIVDMDFGHTQPQWILPLGASASINLDDKKFVLQKNPFNT